MKTNDKSKFMSLINCLIIFVFSVFVNRGISLTSTSLGLDLQNLSDSLPQINGFLQPHRILLPILGRVLTVDLQILNIVFLFLFLFGIYQFILNSTKHHIAFLFVTCIGCTMIIQFTLIYGGYPDVLCYLFLFLTFNFKNKKFLPYIAFFFALLTKETAVFTFLFFLFLDDINKKKLTVSFLSYLPFYFYLSKGIYSPNYFLDLILANPLHFFSQSTDKIFIGYFSSIKFLWVVLFFVIFLDRRIDFKPIVFLNIGIFSQFFLGGDTTRFVSFIFLGFLYIIEKLDRSHLSKIVKILLVVLFLNIFTPKYYVFAYGELTIPNESRLHFIDLPVP